MFLYLVSKTRVYCWADQIFLVGCFALILFVSAADTWLAFVNDNILNVEKNLICTWLLSMDADSCKYFVAGKICGVLLVLLALLGLLRVKYRHARLVVGAVTMFQLGLMTYLCLSDPLMDDWINFQPLLDEAESSVFLQFFHNALEPQ